MDEKKEGNTSDYGQLYGQEEGEGEDQSNHRSAGGNVDGATGGAADGTDLNFPNDHPIHFQSKKMKMKLRCLKSKVTRTFTYLENLDRDI